ncbi:MAG: ATP-dependent sacrificial sulfur transferase LarE [Syntrophobacteraceae bacterium]
MSVAIEVDNELQAKLNKLNHELRSLGKLLVAYSGGVDSAFLAWAAHQVIPGRMLAVISDSPSLAREQLRDAIAFCEECGIPWRRISTGEMQRPEYVRNDCMRCFHCKDELFTALECFRKERHFESIAYGVNTDDQGDYRPGQQAALAHDVKAPLLEAGLSKQDIRNLAHAAGLRVWNKPASACLASRVEYGLEVSSEVLKQIETAEDALRGLGFQQFRVRHHGKIARIEIAREELPRAMSLEMAEKLVSIFKSIGFTYVTLDLEGFRSGSMNAVLPVASLVDAARKQ